MKREPYWDYMARRLREDGVFKNKPVTLESLSIKIMKLEKRVEELENEKRV